MSRAATKEAFYMVGDTCPAIDAALARIRDINHAHTDALVEADEIIKKQTSALREALIEALKRAIEAEDEVFKLESEIDDLRNEVVELKKEITPV